MKFFGRGAIFFVIFFGSPAWQINRKLFVVLIEVLGFFFYIFPILGINRKYQKSE